MRRKELRHLLSGKIFVKGFITLFTMIAIVFAIFAGYVYSNSRTIMNREFLTNSERTAQNLVATVDDNLGNIKEIAASLAIDDNVNLFFNTDHPETIIPDTYSRTQSLLKGYVNGYSSIDSIYLYSERSHTILTPFEKTPVKYFSDTNWVSRFSNLKSGFVTFMRKKNDSYPYLLTLIKLWEQNGERCAIVMNVSLDHMTEINKVEDVAGQTLYIVDENNRQIYSQAQSQLFAPFSQNPYARYVISGLHNQKNIFFRDGKPYALIQIRSGQNPWKYVLVTNLLTYSQQMSNIRLISGCLKN